MCCSIRVSMPYTFFAVHNVLCAAMRLCIVLCRCCLRQVHCSTAVPQCHALYISCCWCLTCVPMPCVIPMVPSKPPSKCSVHIMSKPSTFLHHAHRWLGLTIVDSLDTLHIMGLTKVGLGAGTVARRWKGRVDRKMRVK